MLSVSCNAVVNRTQYKNIVFYQRKGSMGGTSVTVLRFWVSSTALCMKVITVKIFYTSQKTG